jgi:plasmid stabilization system protein ParE
MPIDLVWSRQALDDLEDIYTLIGLDNPVAASGTSSA